MKRRLLTNKGVGLVLSLITLIILSIISVVVYQITRYQIRESVYQERLAQAHTIAEAGLEDALLQLRQDKTWKTGFIDKPFAGGRYTVTVSTHTEPTIRSIGYSKSIVLIGAAVKSVQATARIQSNQLSYGIQADTELKVHGRIDSYDSSNDSNPPIFDFGAHVWSNGKVTTKKGALRIRGDVSYFSGSPPNAETVEGSIRQSTYTMTLPFHDGSPYLTSNDNSNGMTPSTYYNPQTMEVKIPRNKTVTLSAGTYYFKKLHVDGILVLKTSTAPVTVYLAGDLSVKGSNGQIQNTSQIPSRFSLYVQDNSHAHIDFSEPLHGVIEARESQVQINSEIYGNVIGKNIHIKKNGTVHFDRQLTGEQGNTAAIHVTWIAGTWQAGPQ